MTPPWTHKLSELGELLFRHDGHWPEQKIVHDSVWGTRTFEGWEVALMDLPLLQRLRSIHQTSLAYLTFPTALHTRFDHSLGVCSGTKELVSQVLGLRKGYALHDELSAAALLHDIGHGPFSHLSEEAYSAKPGLFADLTYAEEAEPLYPNGSPHEVIGALLLDTGPASRFFEKLNGHYETDLDPARIGSVIAGNGIEGYFQGSMLVNGPFDADKIDYLRRDSMFSGVPIALDVDRLVHSLRVKQDSDDPSRKLVAIKMQGVVSAEQILFGKATLYSTVFHHHLDRVPPS